MGYGGFDHHHGTDHDLSPAGRVDKVMRALGLAPGRFFLGGSAVLALRDIRHVGDLDVGVTTEYWFELLQEREYQVWTPDACDDVTRCDPPYLVTKWFGVEVNIFYGWRWRGAEETRYNDFNEVFRDGIETVGDWPCIKLPILLRQKVDSVQWPDPRAKDLADIQAIAHHMYVEARS